MSHRCKEKCQYYGLLGPVLAVVILWCCMFKVFRNHKIVVLDDV